jgi:hypothetical protein
VPTKSDSHIVMSAPMMKAGVMTKTKGTPVVG